jgi:hypothetical protein
MPDPRILLIPQRLLDTVLPAKIQVLLPQLVRSRQILDGALVQREPPRQGRPGRGGVSEVALPGFERVGVPDEILFVGEILLRLGVEGEEGCD